MNKTIFATLGLVILTALMVQGTLIVNAIPPSPPNPPSRPMQLYAATIEGGAPPTVDPGWAYDTASGEMIMNVYDTLLTFNGEQLIQFLPSLANSWRLDNITGTTSPEGLAWTYRYVFTMKNWANITFTGPAPYNYTVTAADVEYSIERAMAMDRRGGPQWMFYEPLTNSFGSGYLGAVTTVEADAHRVGKIIDHAVASDPNGTVWFNLAFPGQYAPFYQIMSQTWASVLSKQWIITYVNGVRGKNDWDGDWSLARTSQNWTLDHTEWVNHRRPVASPLDGFPNPESGLMHGSGPFILQTFDTVNKFWIMTRNVNYWRGWPADFPLMANAKPAGYVNEIKVTWAFTWDNRKPLFLSGAVDFCAVPREFISEIHLSTTPPFDPNKSPFTNYPKDGIRLIYPLPQLAVDVGFFCFNIDPSSTYNSPGTVFADSHFDQTGIPHDFFGNATWGAHVRKGFAYALDYATFLAQAYLGEAVTPATALIAGLPYYDPTIVGPNYNLTRALQEFSAVPGLIANGFKINLIYNEGNIPRLDAVILMKQGIDALNISTFHVTYSSLPWPTILAEFWNLVLPYTFIGWLADYPDMHNFAMPFYHSAGDYASGQGYSNPTMDALVVSGIQTPDGPARAAIYRQIGLLAVTETVNMPISQGIGRHYERDWVTGWYFNAIYPGNYYYNLWKWYYAPQVLFNPPTQPLSFKLPADLNYDGKGDIKDVSTAAKSFGASAGPPIDARWVFRADVNNDRKIDIKDISYVAKYFGTTVYAVWVPS